MKSVDGNRMQIIENMHLILKPYFGKEITGRKLRADRSRCVKVLTKISKMFSTVRKIMSA